jgi:hypothetical protein
VKIENDKYIRTEGVYPFVGLGQLISDTNQNPGKQPGDACLDQRRAASQRLAKLKNPITNVRPALHCPCMFNTPRVITTSGVAHPRPVESAVERGTPAIDPPPAPGALRAGTANFSQRSPAEIVVFKLFFHSPSVEFF